MTVVDHPVVADRLALLRDRATPPEAFRRLVGELTAALGYEAARELPTEPGTVTTPLAAAPSRRLAGPAPLVVPLLRAGAGMLAAMLRVLPGADTGFLGLLRDDATLAARTYAERVPDHLGGRTVFVLDPMVATGGTLLAAVAALAGRGAGQLVAVALLAAPEGLERLARELPAGVGLHLVLAAVDERLDDRGFIVPGLGDAGDRQFGPL